MLLSPSVSLSMSPPPHLFCTYDRKNVPVNMDAWQGSNIPTSWEHLYRPRSQLLMMTGNRKRFAVTWIYLCVIHESSSSVTWPDLNISQPAWAIIAPLSMQNLWHEMNTVIWTERGTQCSWQTQELSSEDSWWGRRTTVCSFHIIKWGFEWTFFLFGPFTTTHFTLLLTALQSMLWYFSHYITIQYHSFDNNKLLIIMNIST